MQKYMSVAYAVLVLSTNYAADPVRIPTPHEPGLLIPTQAIPLSQNDFISGTYRIQKPGYYYFTEDVAFNPDPAQEAKRKDMPLSEEWFTALSVECDNVIIDLNTKTFSAHKNFVDKQLLKVFSLIELSNMPFPNIKFEFGFKDEEQIRYASNIVSQNQARYASNVVIKNGTIGTSPHHGIHGNNNTNIQLYDLVISDWEVAGIAFNGLKSGVIKNISISGLEHTFSFTGLVSVLLIARLMLEQLILAGDTEAKDYIDPLNTMIADPQQNGSIHPSGLNYGNTYGIFLSRMFDIGPVATSHSPLSTNAILIENVRISNIKIDTLEAVVIGDAKGNAIMPELFGSMRWEDAYPHGVFAPNALLKAQVYVLSKKNPKGMPAGFADNILADNPQESLFLETTRPVFNRDFPIHAEKGIFGIRVDAGHGVIIKDCSIMGLENIGLPGSSLADIPAGSNYSFVPGRFTGNDIHGISLAVCDNCTVSNCEVSACTSTNGNVYGIALLNDTNANRVEKCRVSVLRGDRDDAISPVNPSSSVYGFYIRNSSDSNHCVDCVSHYLQAPRSVYGFYVDNCRDTMITHAVASNIWATSGKNLSAPKESCGIASLGSHGTAVRDSIVREIRSTHENAAAQPSMSRTCGYLFSNGDKDGRVDHCTAECNDGGLGIAAGMYLDNTISTTITNSLSTHATSLFKNGYGFYRTSGAKNAFVLRNSAYGNDKNYESTDVTWPIVSLSSSNVHSANIYNPWYNISIKN